MPTEGKFTPIPYGVCPECGHGSDYPSITRTPSNFLQKIEMLCWKCKAMCVHSSVSIVAFDPGKVLLTCKLCGATRESPRGKWQTPAKEALKSQEPVDDICTFPGCHHPKSSHHFNDLTTISGWCGVLGCQCPDYELRDS